jgi:DNA-directed RNA polymerase subunit N (RpoN/RPB10)
MKKGIFDLIKKIYGSNALSKVLGTRTNVIRLPDNEVKRYIKQELNIEAASDKLAQKAKEEMGELIADLPKMNDAEKLILEGNLRRLANKLGVTEKGPAADVIQFTTKEKISPEGVMSLTEKIGQKNAPGTLMGNLESRIKQLEASGEDLSKLKGKTYDEFMKDITQGQKAMRKLEDEGLVRATAREIIDRDIKSGKIKLPKEIEQDIVQGGGEPINVFRQFYGEDALEQLDSMIPEFKNMYSTREAADAATKKFNFEFKADRPPGSISIEDAKKAKVYRNTDPDELINEYNKNLDLLSQVDEEGGTLIGYQQFQKLQNRNTEIEKILNSIGIKSADSPEGKKITEALIGKPKASVTELVTAEKIISDMKKMDPMDAMYEANKVLKKEGKYKNLKEEDIKRIMDDTNDYIFERDIPKDPEGFAKGGTVSKGLDYLMGVERRGYAEGGTGPSPDAAETYSEYKARMLEALRKSHGGQKTAYTDVQPDGSSSGISRDLPIEDYFNYMLADAYALGFNPNTGLKFGVDDRGVLTDQYKFKQEMADFKKNSQTTPTEDFSDYLNTTTINTNVQTTPTEDFSDPSKYTVGPDGNITKKEVES